MRGGLHGRPCFSLRRVRLATPVGNSCVACVAPQRVGLDGNVALAARPPDHDPVGLTAVPGEASRLAQFGHARLDVGR